MPKLTHKTAALRAIGKNFKLLGKYEDYDRELAVKCELCFGGYKISLKEIMKGERKCCKISRSEDNVPSKDKASVLAAAGISFDGKCYRCNFCDNITRKTVDELAYSIGCDYCALNKIYYSKKCELYGEKNGLTMLRKDISPPPPPG